LSGLLLLVVVMLAKCCAVAALLPVSLTSRIQGASTSLAELFTEKEALSAARTRARFEAAFWEELTNKNIQCPYGDKAMSLIGGNTSYTCHYHLPTDQGFGRTCPDLQQRRMQIARKFIAGHYSNFVDAAEAFDLKPLFDKTDLVHGDESYENMVRYHINGLMNPDIEQIEDKIKMKKLVASLGIPSTVMYYGAHKSTFKPDEFKQKLLHLCNEEAVDDFIIKATHLAWSGGQKIVRGWLQRCKNPQELDDLVQFVQTEALDKLAGEADAHLREYLEPGFTVEELFKSSLIPGPPLEVKAQVIWGKLHQVFLIGQDHRGCNVGSGSWNIYSDGTGWTMGGPLPESSDASHDVFMKKFFDRVKDYAEKFAVGVGADYTRVDFFLAGLEDGQEPVIKLNEAETVSGLKHVHDRFGLGGVWRDGYVTSGRMRMTADKWDEVWAKMQQDRDNSHID